MMSALNTQTMSAYTIGVAAPDEPWQQERSQPQIEKQFELQSMVPDQEKRKQLIWEIDKQLQEDQARPIIWYDRLATCWQPRVKGLTTMVNSICNGYRFEEVWLDQ
jgi:peptide/nickel transport system substrate-binding protein